MLSFSVLIVKRYLEFPKRLWKIWALDTSKQGFSQLIAHFINVLISLVLSNRLSNDACLWYFITNVLDNTLGVFIIILILKLVEGYLLADRWPEYISGNYYDIIEYEDSNPGNSYVSTNPENKDSIRSLAISQQKRIVV